MRSGWGRVRRLVVALAFVGLLAGNAGAVDFVFVAPVPRPGVAGPVATLSGVTAVTAGGGRALAFRELAPGEDSRADRVRSALAASPALAAARALWDLARQLAPAPAAAWLASSGPVPVWVLPAGAEPRGPGMLSLVPLWVQGQSGRAFAASQLLLLADLRLPDRTVADLDGLRAVGLLVPMVGHEIFHGLHADLTRERFLLLDLASTPFAGPHDSPQLTDPALAFKEGFAEAGELWLARRFPAEFAPPPAAAGPVASGSASVPAPVRALAASWHQRRIRLAGRNRYIFAADGRVRDGQLDPGADDLATEGIVATLIYTLMTHANLEQPERQIFAVLAAAAPTSLFELVSALARGEPAAAATVQRILLEYTRYTIASPEAIARYAACYLAKKAFVQGKLERAEYQRARQAWEDWKAVQRARIAAGAPLSGAVPQPLPAATRQGATLDLNDADGERLAWHLEAFLPPALASDGRRLAATLAAAIVVHRRKLGTFTSPSQLHGVIPAWLCDKLAAGVRRFQANLERRLAASLQRRRQLAGL